MIYERKIGTAGTVSAPLIAWSTTSYHTSLTTTMFAAGDVKVSIDYAGFTNTATLPTHIDGKMLVLSLTAAELTGRHLDIIIVDQTDPKVWEDQAILIETYGSTTAMHAFDRNQTVVMASLTSNQSVSVQSVEALGATAASQVLTQCAAALANASVTANVMNTVITNLDAAISTIPSATTTAQAVWNMTQSAFAVAGTFGNLLDATVSGIAVGTGASDWTDGEKAQIRFALGVSGSSTSGTGGIINSISSLLTTNLDAAVSTRSTFDPTASGVTLTASQAGVTIAAVTAVTTVSNLGASAASQVLTQCTQALANTSVTSNVMNTVITNLDTTVSSRSTFDAAATGVTLTASQTGVTIANVTTVNNLGASAASQVLTQCTQALANTSVTSNVMNTVITNLDTTVSSRSSFDPAATGVTLTASQTGVTIGRVNDFGASATAQINAEMLDVLTVDTFAEPGSVPAATASLKDKLGWVQSLARNKVTQTATLQTLRNDADGANIATSTHSDDGTTHTRGEFT